MESPDDLGSTLLDMHLDSSNPSGATLPSDYDTSQSFAISREVELYKDFIDVLSDIHERIIAGRLDERQAHWSIVVATSYTCNEISKCNDADGRSFVSKLEDFVNARADYLQRYGLPASPSELSSTLDRIYNMLIGMRDKMNAPEKLEIDRMIQAARLMLIARDCHRFWKLAQFHVRSPAGLSHKTLTIEDEFKSLCDPTSVTMSSARLSELSIAVLRGALHTTTKLTVDDAQVLAPSLSRYFKDCFDDRVEIDPFIAAILVDATIQSYALISRAAAVEPQPSTLQVDPYIHAEVRTGMTDEHDQGMNNGEQHERVGLPTTEQRTDLPSDVPAVPATPQTMVRCKARVQEVTTLLSQAYSHPHSSAKKSPGLVRTLAALERFATCGSTDIHRHSPFTAASMHVAMDSLFLIESQVLLNHGHIVASIFHMYNALRQANLVEPREILEECQSLFVKELYGGSSPPVADFQTAFKESLGMSAGGNPSSKRSFKFEETTLIRLWTVGNEQFTPNLISILTGQPNGAKARALWQALIETDVKAGKSELQVLIQWFENHYRGHFEGELPIMRLNLFMIYMNCVDIAGVVRGTAS